MRRALRKCPRAKCRQVHVGGRTKPKFTNADEVRFTVWDGLGVVVGTGVCLLGTVALIANFLDVPMDLIEDESKSAKKMEADSLSGDVYDEEGKLVGLRRVKQKRRCPVSVITQDEFNLCDLDGAQWIEDSKNAYYQQKYWNDEAAFELQSAEAKMLRDASYNLHAMVLEAVDLVTKSDELMDIFEIPYNLREAVKASWARRDKDLLGRFDMIWDGRGHPKLLEYNADTPTILVESSLYQERWWKFIHDDKPKNSWQFNTILSRLHTAWPLIVPKGQTLHIAGCQSTIEEKAQMSLMSNSALAVGLDVKTIDIEGLQVSEGKLEHKFFREPIHAIWKLYPYEWFANEYLGNEIFDSSGKSTTQTTWLEPPWKLIASNKALLALLWQMYPDHPNLLPATFDEREVETFKEMHYTVVAKPKYGREGNGIVYSKDFTTSEEFIQQAKNASKFETTNPDDAKDTVVLDMMQPIYQVFHPIQRFSGRNIVIGSWVIHGVPCGFCFREDPAETTSDNSCFVPHYIVGDDWIKSPLPELTPRQTTLYNSIYSSSSLFSSILRYRPWSTTSGVNSGVISTDGHNDIIARAKAYANGPHSSYGSKGTGATGGGGGGGAPKPPTSTSKPTGSQGQRVSASGSGRVSS